MSFLVQKVMISSQYVTADILQTLASSLTILETPMLMIQSSTLSLSYSLRSPALPSSLLRLFFSSSSNFYCIIILLISVDKFCLRTDQRSSTRKTAENNRNWTLFYAQIAFMTLSGQHSQVQPGVCQAFGAVIHLLYLAFFSWTGMARN